MEIQRVQSFIAGEWQNPDSNARDIFSAINGKKIAVAGNTLTYNSNVLDYAKTKGGPALRSMGFHDRAKLLKALAIKLNENRKILYELSFETGATQKDHVIDIDGGIGTAFVFASKARRELPDNKIWIDGRPEILSREGNFLGQHIFSPRHGVALQINAFNFPVWGMLEKLAPAILAGIPVIVKPATDSCYVTEAAVKLILNSGILPEGSLQLVCGSITALLNQLNCQDVVSFTGSQKTALTLRNHPRLSENSVKLITEQDSLNATILCPESNIGNPEYELFIKEIIKEITTKAGQKCTAIRRILVPQKILENVSYKLSQILSSIKVGDPRDLDTQMGALISQQQKNDVAKKVEDLSRECEVSIQCVPQDVPAQGSYYGPTLLIARNPDTAVSVHSKEAFGPVATLMGYRDLDHASSLINKGGGSLVASLFTNNPENAGKIITDIAPFHGRLYINNRASAKEATGHGSPLPHMIHGGPGRAGGGEELGGVRAISHYMQRTAIQAHPEIISCVCRQWTMGANKKSARKHPFDLYFEELEIGYQLNTGSRKISLEDIEYFASFTGDKFYAHMDEDAAKRNPFFPGRVAHGYLLLSFAAGLFVKPDEGPVLANTGLDNLRFWKPVIPSDTIKVTLTVKQKTRRNKDYGEVRWDVRITNQDSETVADYELLTMNSSKNSSEDILVNT